MGNNKILRLVTAALMSAITCVATLTLQIPNGIGGYIHPGDAFVILSGIILGPFYGGLGAGIGSMLADLLSGYVQYALPTFCIKALAAILAYLLYRLIRIKLRFIAVIFGGILAGAVVTISYFLYDGFLYGSFASSALGIPGNLLQNLTGIVLSTLIYVLVYRIPQIKEMIENKN